MIRRMVLLVVLIVAIAGLHPGTPTSPAMDRLAMDAAAREAPLDLSWLAPVPADLADGYGISNGTYQTAAETPGSVFGDAGAPTSLNQALADAGSRQTYWRRSILRSEDDPDLYARLFDSLLIEFGDEAGAEAGFAAFHDLLTGYDELRTAPEVGDEALAFRGEFTDANQGAYKEVRVLTRTGRFLIDLDLWDFTGDAPSTSEVVAIAGVMAERLAGAASSASSASSASLESPMLAVEVPRLAGEDVSTSSDYYTRMNGEEIPTDGVSTSQLQSNAQYFDDIGNTDRSYYFASTVPGDDDDHPYISLLVELYRFADEDSADAYLQTVAENWIETRSAPYHDAEMVDEAAEFGDGSAFAAYEYDYSWGTVPGYHFWLRVGDQLASVEMDGDPALSPADAEQLAELQVTCLEDGGCAEPLAASDLGQGSAGAIPAETPEATDEPRADATTEPGQDVSLKPTAEPDAVPTEVTVAITSTGFDPNPVVISAGDTVTWVNDDTGAAHGVTVLSAAGFVDASDTLQPGVSYSHTFTEPGTYPYVEVFNPALQGTVIVE